MMKITCKKLLIVVLCLAINISTCTINTFAANSNININNQSIRKLTSTEIGELTDAVVYIEVDEYDGLMSSGSGFFISNDGKLITNYHVISNAKKIYVINNKNKTYSGKIKILNYDIDKDIALLQIDNTTTNFLELGDSDKVKLGQKIYTIGSPEGYQNTLSDGLISSIREDLIQITAPISHGSSGGALLNEYGQVIGITSCGVLEGENLGFAIPINEYKHMNNNTNSTIIQNNISSNTNIIARTNDYSQLKEQLQKLYGDVNYNGYKYHIDNIFVEDDNGTLYVTFLMDSVNTEYFIKGCLDYGQDIENYYINISEQLIKTYNNKDVHVGVALYDFFTKCPNLKENMLYDETTTYNNDLNKWEMFYPFLSVYNFPSDDYFDTRWFNEEY